MARGLIVRAGLITLALLCASFPATADPHGIAVLQTLDKVTARVATREVRVGTAFRVGSLLVGVYGCDKRPPEETPESAAFLDIQELRPGEPGVSVFVGWMFASSPAINSLEHPVYDVWVLDCKEPLAPE